MTEIPEVRGEDIRAVNLSLATPATPDHLSVFIQDPKNRRLYYYRKIGLKSDSVPLETSDKELPYIDVITVDMGEISRVPVPDYQLDEKVMEAVVGEQQVLQFPDPAVKALHAAVGVARYMGGNLKTVDELVTVVGMRYCQLRASQGN